jgi:hypothetical protein
MGLGDAVKEYEPIHDKIMPQIIVDEHIHPTIEDNGENSSMLHKLILLCSALDFNFRSRHQIRRHHAYFLL